jgi:hypothetical protein
MGAIVGHFGLEFHVVGIEYSMLLFGKQRFKKLFVDKMGTMEQQIEGSKQLYIPRSASDYPLKELVGFLKDLKQLVAVDLLVTCHDSTVASAALINAHGGSGAVGKLLKTFRAALPGFLHKYSYVVFGKDKKSNGRRGVAASYCGEGTALV